MSNYKAHGMGWTKRQARELVHWHVGHLSTQRRGYCGPRLQVSCVSYSQQTTWANARTELYSFPIHTGVSGGKTSIIASSSEKEKTGLLQGLHGPLVLHSIRILTQNTLGLLAKDKGEINLKVNGKIVWTEPKGRHSKNRHLKFTSTQKAPKKSNHCDHQEENAPGLRTSFWVMRLMTFR